jgi:hypothetical protein
MEKILKIEPISDYDHKDADGWSNSFDGYKITTDQQEILCLISNGQSCCESWGIFESQDDYSDFIGATLNDVKIVDTALNVEKWNKDFEYGLDAGGVMFVNFETDAGTFQLAAYNSHNGYYGHSAILISKQVNESVGV